MTSRRLLAAQRNLGRLREQNLDDRVRGGGVDVAVRQVDMPEGLVRELEADAAVHRRQRRLRDAGLIVIAIDVFGAHGQQPDRPASRTDQSPVIGEAGVLAGADLLDGGDGVELVELRGDDGHDLRLAGRDHPATALCRRGIGEPPGHRVRTGESEVGRSRCGRGRGVPPILDGHGEPRPRRRFGDAVRCGPQVGRPHRRVRESVQRRLIAGGHGLGPPVSGIGGRDGGHTRRQRFGDGPVAVPRADDHGRLVVDDAGQRVQQRGMRRELHERIRPAAAGALHSQIESHCAAKVFIPVAGVVGRRRHLGAAGGADEPYRGVPESRLRGQLGQRGAQWSQRAGVAGIVDEELMGEDLPLLRQPHRGGHRVVVAGDHGGRRPVDRRNLHPAGCCGQQRLGVGGTGAQHGHRVAAGQPVDDGRAGDHQGDGVRQRDRFGDIRRRHLTEAVPDGHFGQHPEAAPRFGQGDRMGELRALDLGTGPALLVGAHQIRKRGGEPGGDERLRAPIGHLAVGRQPPVGVGAHRLPLIALPRKYERDPRRRRPGRAGDQRVLLAAGDRRQSGGEFGAVRRAQQGAVPAHPPQPQQGRGYRTGRFG